VIFHADSHDPTLMHADCETCNAALRIVFNKLADLNLGPRDADTLVERIREMARG